MVVEEVIKIFHCVWYCIYQGPSWNFFRLNSNMSSMIVKTPDLKKETSVAFGPIGDIYHSYTHVNTGPTVKSSVLIRIHPKCNVHHNQRNHDVVVIILLAYWFISLLPLFCMSLMNSRSLPLGYKGMNGVINSCRFRLLY